MSNYETIIGVEVHTELNTKRKIFSPSLNDINAKPNTNVHPIDLAFPGTLPRFNREVLDKAITVCLGLNMDITRHMHWDRKNYFYPDNPKGYQITQQQTPIGRCGYITLNSGKKITIDFMHMEEDTAKSFHVDGKTKLDFNRCGVPLLEIVSAPQLRSAEEAKEYLEKLRETLLYLDASDCKMEEGSFRVDVNISVRPYGQEQFNTKVEVKNLNSFSNVVKAIEQEVSIQTYAYNNNQKIQQATKRYSEQQRKLVTMRIKESVDDYRYMQEPDLPEIVVSDDEINKLKTEMPLLPGVIRTKILNDFKIDEKTTNVLMSDVDMTKFLFACVDANLDAKQICNYLTVNINEHMNKQKVNFTDLNLTVENFIQLDELLSAGKISTNHIKKIIPAMIEQQLTVKEIVKKLGIEQITDINVLQQFIDEALSENEQSIEDYKNGKDRAFGFLIGVIMKKSRGQANPTIINDLLKKSLDDE